MDRREFLKFLGMASSATVLSSCEPAADKLVSQIAPYDADYIPGEAMYKHSACVECPAGCSTSVKIVDFNPIKLEGSASHPLNNGALCLRGQTSLTRLYHLDRLRSPQVKKGENWEQIAWGDAFKLINAEMRNASGAGKANVYLSGGTNGSLSEMINEFAAANGVERLPEYEAISHSAIREAGRILFGRREVPGYRIDHADLLITLGADILETFVSPVSFGVQVRKAKQNADFHWLHLEPHVSMTGFKATERRNVKAGSEPYLLAFMINYVEDNGLAKNSLPAAVKGALPRVNARQAAEMTGIDAEELNKIAQMYAEATTPLLIAGGVSTAQANGLETAILAGLLQYITGTHGNTVDYAYSYNMGNTGSLLDVRSLVKRLNSSRVGVAFVSRTDPAATLPASIDINNALAKATFRVALTDQMSVTANACDLILPLSNGLESWGDVSPQYGITNFMQPAIQQLYDTMSEGDILIGISASGGKSLSHPTYTDWIKARWAANFGSDVDTLLAKGHAMGGALSSAVKLNATTVADALGSGMMKSSASGTSLFIVPSIRTYDGRSAALQLTSEIPDPLSTVSYGSWIGVSEENAESVGLRRLDYHQERDYNISRTRRPQLAVSVASVSVNVPGVTQAGLAPDSYLMHLDQVDRGMLSFDQRTGEILSRVDGVSVSPTGTDVALAVMAGQVTQGHRNLTREEHVHEIPWLKGNETLYAPHKYPEYRWSMSIDNEACTGCSACVAACYIENNIPCVGEDENLRGREMSWIRIQPYYFEDGSMDSLVMLCQQCGSAPCENVCPVYATYHNNEGLNVMVYNRCVGTRYCHNNCPYKVRRFNWFDWTDRGYWDEPMNRMVNPDIWVRPKGVMEKCTFCVQRIRVAKDTAKDEGRKVQDGEVTPACAQTCPTNAITFGNILDKNSEVYKKSKSNRSYRVLEQVGTDPAVHYLRKEEEA